MWVQLQIILCQTGLSCHLYFLTSGHSDAQGWRLNPVCTGCFL